MNMDIFSSDGMRNTVPGYRIFFFFFGGPTVAFVIKFAEAHSNRISDIVLMVLQHGK